MGAPGAGAAGRRVTWQWGVTRLVTLLILVPENNILGDVRYYGRQLHALFGPASITDVLREYPAPAFAVFLPPWGLALGNRTVYLGTFVAAMVALDAAFTVALWRGSGRRATPGLWLWLLLAPCLGPLLYTRFDLVPAALAGAALLAVAGRHPARAGLLAAAGAAVKLWPAALLPALLLPRPGRRRLVAWFAAAGVVIAGLTVVLCGTARLVSPLTWQGNRGLQIESLFAVPLMWGRVISPGTWDAPYTSFFAYQIEGPGTSAMMLLSTISMGLAVVLVGWLWWRCLRWARTAEAAGSATAPTLLALAGLLSVLIASLLIITNKTLSPQYIVWIGGLLAALGCAVPDEPVLRRLIGLLLITCVITQVIFPIGYALLTHETWASAIGVTLLTVRNVLLAAGAVMVARRLVTLTRLPGPPPA